MATVLYPWQILVAAMAGWITHQQDAVIDYLREENRVLKQQLGRRRLRLTDAQRRRLAVRGKAIGRRALAEVASLVTPDTILRWHRQLICKEMDPPATIAWSASDHGSHRRPRCPNGARESPMGLHANPRCAQERRSSSGPDHDRQHLERERNRSRSGTRQANDVGSVSQGPLDVLAAADFFTVEV